MRIGYLGPDGTFSKQAVVMYNSTAEHIAFPTIEDAIKAVDQRMTDEAVIPLENSTEGVVNIAMDTLIFNAEVFIKAGFVMPIENNLMTRPEFVEHTPLKILSHTQPLHQCRRYLCENFKTSELLPVASTSEAARLVSVATEPIYAVAPRICADLYGLTIVKDTINDEKNNATGFIVIKKDNTLENTAGYKTTIAFSTINKPGELYKILDIFSLWDLNMTKIFSRPSKLKAGEYVFYIDLESYEEPQDVLEALTMVKRKTAFYKFLGSYPMLKL